LNYSKLLSLFEYPGVYMLIGMNLGVEDEHEHEGRLESSSPKVVV
jgi:hypothetical protein